MKKHKKGEQRLNRKEEVLNICNKLDQDTLNLVTPLIEELVFLEERLAYLKKLPFIIVKEDDLTKQKVTPAYKQYKDLSQSYINAFKVVTSALGVDDSQGAESPLREWLKSRTKQQEKNE